MKKNLEQILINAYGKPFEPTMALGVACFQALNGAFESDKQITAEEKLKIYRVGKKIAAGGVADFSSEELALIKDRVGKMYGPMPVGAIYDILDADFVEPA